MSPNPEHIKARQPMRADFVSELVEFDKTTGIANFKMRPDPRRYDKIERDGETLYLDRYLGHAFSLDDMAAGGWKGTPLYSLTPRVDSTIDYASARQSALENEMTSGEYAPPVEDPQQHRFLGPEVSEYPLGFLSVDICGATALRNKSTAGFDRAYELFIRELGTVVGQFNGSILKTKGDGFIAFIQHPSFTRLCDNLVDMGISFLVVLHESLNPALAKAGLDPLNIRVGADYGDGVMKALAVPATGFVTYEVASDALNRAVKIEEACAINQFWIGRHLYELIHVGWLERASEVPFDGTCVGISDYKAYRIR